MPILDLFRKKKSETLPGQTVSEVNQIFDDNMDVARMMIQRIWWRNLLYYIGEQWIEFAPVQNTFIPRFNPYLGSPSVSNEIREYCRSVKAMLLNQKLIPVISPNTDEQEDKDAAKLGEDLLVWMDGINDGEFQEEKEKLTLWISIAGTGFLRTFIEADQGRLIAGHESGTLRTGEVNTENVIPFNVFPDRIADKMRRMRYVGIQTLKPVEWVEDTFKTKVPPGENTQAMDYQRQIMRLVGRVSPWKGYGLQYQGQAADLDADQLCVLREVEFSPNKAYPKGRYVVVASNIMLHDVDRMPIAVEKDGSWYWTLTDFHYNYVPGRFWSDGGVNDLIPQQNAINEIDDAMKNNRKMLGRNRVITPGEITLKRKTERGESFLMLEYSGKETGGQAPVFQQGTPLPQQFLEERAVHKTQIQDMSGDPKNVLKGHAPSAQASGIMVDMLTETAKSGQAPDVERYQRDMGKVYKKRLLCAKEDYTEERTIKITGRGRKAEIKQFKAADLRENTDIKLEADSGLATTSAGRRQALMDMVKAGLFGPAETMPISTKQEIFRRVGLSGFTDQTNADFERAQRENSAILAGLLDGIMTVTTPVGPDSQVVMDDPLFKYDDDEIHYEVHKHLIIGQEFIDLPKPIQAALVVHTDVHHARMEAKKAMEAQMQAGPGPGAPPGPGMGPQGPQPGQGPTGEPPAPPPGPTQMPMP